MEKEHIDQIKQALEKAALAIEGGFPPMFGGELICFEVNVNTGEYWVSDSLNRLCAPTPLGFSLVHICKECGYEKFDKDLKEVEDGWICNNCTSSPSIL